MVTASTAFHHQKGQVSKIQVSCPDVSKMYNKEISGVDLIDQRAAAYYLDRKSTIRFYFRIFFDLMDVTAVLFTI